MLHTLNSNNDLLFGYYYRTLMGSAELNKWMHKIFTKQKLTKVEIYMFILWSHKTIDQLFVKLINAKHTLLSILTLKSEEPN